jgi:hypothetical protein
MRSGVVKVGIAVGLVAIAGWVLVGRSGTQKSQGPASELSIAETAITVEPENVPVLYIENRTPTPRSCDDVDITKSAIGLFGATARSDDGTKTIRLVVEDDLPDLGWVEPDPPPAKASSNRLRIVAYAAGSSDAENTAIEQQALKNASLAAAGEPQSLTVKWPGGYQETGRGLAWSVSAGLADPEPDYEYNSELAVEEESDFDVRLTWNSIDERGESGAIFLAGPLPVLAEREIAGFSVLVAMLGEGATQADADNLARGIKTAPFRCSAEVSTYAPDPSRMTRVVGGEWVAYLDGKPSSKECAVPRAMLFIETESPALSEFRNCSPQQTFSVDRYPNRSNQPDSIAFVASRSVASIRLRDPAGRVVSDYSVVPRNGDAFSVVAAEFPTDVSAEVMVIEALDKNGAVQETAAYGVGCVYTESCSALHPLLVQPAITVDLGYEEYESSLHLGAADLPAKPFPEGRNLLAPVEFATTSKQWCALLDMKGRTTTQDEPDRDGMSSCVEVDKLARDTLAVETQTLDYVGAMSVSVVVVGPDTSQLRVTVEGSQTTFNVNRSQPGPGATTFEDPSFYGDKTVTYEALDSSGNVIATTRSSS